MRAIYETKGRAREYFELAINLFSGCGHACTYCYGANVTHQNWDSFTKQPHPRMYILEKLQHDARLLEGKETRPILMCFVTDPYQPVEAETQTTRQAIKILKQYGLRVAILSKGGLRATRDLDLLDENDWFGATLTLTNKEDATKWEPIADTWENRLIALQMAKEKGIPTWVSCEPVIDPEQTLELIRLSAPYVDVFKVGKINYNPIERMINWKYFALDVTALLDELGKRYYIKKDLATFIDRPGGINKGNCG